MIAKSSKFPMRTHFTRFRSRAQRSATPHLTIYSTLHTSHLPRLSVVVPKKVSKSAVVRNWLKRLVYDSLWLQIKDKPIDCVVVFKPISLVNSQSTHSAILKELDELVT